jgi:ABC-type lipoprotein release transport system permease subunit
VIALTFLAAAALLGFAAVAAAIPAMKASRVDVVEALRAD